MNAPETNLHLSAEGGKEPELDLSSSSLCGLNVAEVNLLRALREVKRIDKAIVSLLAKRNRLLERTQGIQNIAERILGLPPVQIK